MNEQELREKIVDILYRHKEDDTLSFTADQILALIKEAYPLMYQEEADFIGWLLSQGWIPPGEARCRLPLSYQQRLPGVTPKLCHSKTCDGCEVWKQIVDICFKEE